MVVVVVGAKRNILFYTHKKTTTTREMGNNNDDEKKLGMEDANLKEKGVKQENVNIGIPHRVRLVAMIVIFIDILVLVWLEGVPKVCFPSQQEAVLMLFSDDRVVEDCLELMRVRYFGMNLALAFNLICFILVYLEK